MAGFRRFQVAPHFSKYLNEADNNTNKTEPQVPNFIFSDKSDHL